MKEKYLKLVKEQLLSSKNKKNLFFLLLNHFEINELKRLPDFNSLKDFLISLKIDPQEIFEKIAITAVQKNKLDVLMFLMDECHYDLTKTADSNQVTLLHEACLYGVNDIVKYLLQKGFNPNAQDFQGDTPLHRVVQRAENTSIIAILQQHKANLNIKNKIGLTPLFTAILYGNSAAHLKFINEMKVNRKITCTVAGKELDYLQFKLQVQDGIIQHESRIIESPRQAGLTEQIMAKYYLKCLLPKFNRKAFLEVKSQLKAVPEQLNESESQYLIDALVLTSLDPFQPQALIEEVLTLIQRGKLTSEFAVSGLLNSAKKFIDQNQIETVIQLNNFILSQLENNKVDTEKAVYFYHFLGVLYKQIGIFSQAEYCIKQAITKLPEEKSDKEKMEIFFNLACIQVFLLKRKEALESFKKAFYFDPTDEAAFAHYLIYLLEFDYYDEVLQVCAASQFDEASKIFTAYVQTLKGNLSWEDLLKILNNIDTSFSSQLTIITTLNLKADCYIKLQDFEQAIMAITESLLMVEEDFKSNKDVNIASAMFKTLYVYMEASKYGSGLKLVEDFKKKYPLEFNYSVLCNAMAAAFYLIAQQFDEANALIQKIRNLGIHSEVVCHLYLLFAAEILSRDTATSDDTAIQYIDLALEINPSNFKGRFYKLLCSILKADPVATKSAFQSIALKDMNIVIDILKEKKEATPLAELISLELGKYDPVKIHEFFQAEKALLLNKTAAILPTNPKPKTKWNINHVCFEEGMEGLIRIQYPRFLYCYAVIPPHFNPPYLGKFKLALSKSGYYQMDLSEDTNKVSRKQTDGVQTLNGAVIQLKIHEDNRLWTDTIYCVDDKYLIVFDQHGYHPDVKRIARKGERIKIIDLSERSLSLSNPGNISGVFTPPPKEPSEDTPTVAITNILQM